MLDRFKPVKILTPLLILLFACENREVNYEDGPNFSEIHEDIHYNFDKVALDGTEYFILERDRNNPHEGFGFMALNGNDIKQNQDSIKAYLKTILDFQVQISSRLENVPVETKKQYSIELFDFYFQKSISPYYSEKEFNEAVENEEPQSEEPQSEEPQ
jgi:hypothetical protein